VNEIVLEEGFSGIPRLGASGGCQSRAWPVSERIQISPRGRSHFRGLPWSAPCSVVVHASR